MAHVQLAVVPSTQVLLVVDDRPENLAAMEALLEEGDWRLRCVDSGEAALQCLLEDNVN